MSEDRQAASSLVGVVLDGTYRIERLLGEGGMGAVYRATQLRLEKPVAIKVMARELSAASEALARFHREALVTSNLGHPNIVQVFDLSAMPTGEPFLVMELLEGEDLDRRLRRDRRLSPPTMLHIIKQVAPTPSQVDRTESSSPSPRLIAPGQRPRLLHAKVSALLAAG